MIRLALEINYNSAVVPRREIVNECKLLEKLLLQSKIVRESHQANNVDYEMNLRVIVEKVPWYDKRLQ